MNLTSYYDRERLPRPRESRGRLPVIVGMDLLPWTTPGPVEENVPLKTSVPQALPE